MQDILDKFNLTDVFAIFPVGMADDDEDGDEGNDDGSDDGDGDEGENASGAGEGDTDAGDGTDSKGSGRIKKLSEEAKQHRLAKKAAEKQLADVQAKLKEFEDKDKSETEKLSGTVKELTEKNAKLEERANQQARKLAFYDSGAAKQFRNPATALKLLDLNDIEIDEDGEIDGDEIKKRAEALLKAEPYLAVSDSGDDGENSNDDLPDTPNVGGNKKKSGKKVDNAALAKRFPALAGRV